MITSITRQSVIIKCNMQSAYLLGNYEFYYAAGLACRLFDLKAGEDSQPEELAKVMKEQLKQVAGSNEKEQYLVSILKDYMPEERYDEQMKELFLWGMKEEKLWQVTI